MKKQLLLLSMLLGLGLGSVASMQAGWGCCGTKVKKEKKVRSCKPRCVKRVKTCGTCKTPRVKREKSCGVCKKRTRTATYDSTGSNNY